MENVDVRYIIILVCIMCLSGCGPSDANFSVFSTIQDQSGQHTVIIESAHSILANGPETIRVYVKSLGTGKLEHIVTTKIANDGGEISSTNIRSEWKNSNTLSLCLSGVEQEDRVLDIYVRTLSYSETVEKCANFIPDTST